MIDLFKFEFPRLYYCLSEDSSRFLFSNEALVIDWRTYMQEWKTLRLTQVSLVGNAQRSKISCTMYVSEYRTAQCEMIECIIPL